MTITPKLILLGAGPGDPELITVKGLKALQNADIVLYDALVSKHLLSHTKKTCKCIFTGKRAGKHQSTQEEINRMIINYAYQYGTVVRLKGGDPFVFGRGQEEMAYAATFGVELEVIPGLSSALAIPVLQHIPLTARYISSGVRICSAVDHRGRMPESLKSAVSGTDTVVILMGAARLGDISALFRAAGRGDIPVAVISNGSMKNESVITGAIGEIEKQIGKREIPKPAIIVVGSLARYAKSWKEYKTIDYVRQGEN